MRDKVAAELIEHLRMWDEDEAVWSIEMGGLGPAYEQAIQILVIEIIRNYLHRPLPTKKTWNTFGDDTVKRIDRKLPDGTYSCGGFSGAQVGAAKNLAFEFLRKGRDATLKSVSTDRHILVSKRWPRPYESVSA